MSSPDNGGAEMIVRDFRPRRLVVPFLRTRSQMEKTMPDLIALAGTNPEPWQRGQSFALSPQVAVDVLGPSPSSTDNRADDRSLALLFHAGGRTLLWAGRLGPQAQQELLAAYPALRADVLVMGVDSPPSEDWLRALQVREWLQIPPRDQWSNTANLDVPSPDFCQVWPLNQTGSVDVRFQPAQDNQPPGIFLRPWLALP
jgi:hypothetical protein